MREILAKILHIGENFSQNEGKIQKSSKSTILPEVFQEKQLRMTMKNKLEMA